jgi:hypothetical protein
MDIPKQNADIIHVLTKMNIYLNRDRINLNKLSPLEQNKRIQKAFDRAVENCCILPLLFTKRELASGNLVLSDRQEWEGWKESRMDTFGRFAQSASRNMPRMKPFVDAIGVCAAVLLMRAPFKG